MQKVRADIYVPGQGDEAHEAEYCYLSSVSPQSTHCPIGGCECRFGLTEIEVPAVCPLRLGEVIIKLSVIRKAATAAGGDDGD